MTAADSQDPQHLREQVAKHPFWYHKIALPGGVVTPGENPVFPHAYRVPEDLSGKRVLDVGAWDGYWTFEALRRGAREVVAIDDFSDYLGKLAPEDRHAWATFDLCRQALGIDASRCHRQEMSIYEVSEQRLGRFDVVFCFGTLYHLRHPLLALDLLSAICDSDIFIESQIANDFSPCRGGLGKGYGNEMVMEFFPDNQLAGNDTNWWAPTLNCLAHMTRVSGFASIEGWKLVENPPHVGLCRGFVFGSKSAEKKLPPLVPTAI